MSSDNIYFNIKKTYDGESTFQFNENRVSPILKNPNDYQVAVQRFSIPTKGIPVLFDVPNRYILHMAFDGIIVSKTVIFPSETVDTNPLYPPYKGIWTYYSLIQGINNTFQNAVNDMIVQKPSFPTNIAPKMSYDPMTQLFSIYTTNDYTSLVQPEIKIFFNKELYTLFLSFQYIKFIYNNLDIYEIIISGIRPVNIGNYTLQTIQDFPTTQQINCLSDIIFETNSLPLNSQLVGSQKNETKIIINDYIVYRELSDRMNIDFNPTGDLLFQDLISNSPLHRIDLKIYWSDQEGNYHPLILDSFSPIDIKLVFRKKISERLRDEYEKL